MNGTSRHICSENEPKGKFSNFISSHVTQMINWMDKFFSQKKFAKMFLENGRHNFFTCNRQQLNSSSSFFKKKLYLLFNVKEEKM